MSDLLLPTVIGLISGALGTVFGVWWQRRDSRAEWLRVLRFEQFVELDRRVRELVASATRGFELAEKAALLQVQARQVVQESRALDEAGDTDSARARLKQAIELHHEILELADPYHEATAESQSQVRQIGLDLGRYQILLSDEAIGAVTTLLEHLGTWLALDLTGTWMTVADLEARPGLETAASQAAERAERELEMGQQRIEVLRESVAIAQRDFLRATKEDLRLR